MRFNREEAIRRLEPIQFEAEENDEEAKMEQMSLAGVMLTLANVNHEREYEYCRGAALHLLGKLNEPEDIELD